MRGYNMKLIIGADFVPTDSNVKYFESGELEYLFDQEAIYLSLLLRFLI